MEIKRDILNNLNRWKESRYRKPLVLQGVGCFLIIVASISLIMKEDRLYKVTSLDIPTVETCLFVCGIFNVIIGQVLYDYIKNKKKKPRGYYDAFLKQHRIMYDLDLNPCVLSVFFNDKEELLSFSFDVEKAEDYHVSFKANQLPKLCNFLNCTSFEIEDIVSAFNEQVKTWKTPVEIFKFLKKARIKYETCSFYHPENY